MNSQYQQLLDNLAQDYYLSKMAISDIPKEYNLSRYLIMKYLDRAFSSGIVDVSVYTDYDRNAQLKRELSDSSDIKNVYVTKNPSNPLDYDEIATNFAANQIQFLIREYKIIGLSWGGTIYTILDHFSKHSPRNLVFTQFVGGSMKHKSSTISVRMVQKAVPKYDYPYYTIPGPLYILNDEARNDLYSESAFTGASKVANKMEMIVCGLGTLQLIDSIPAWYGYKRRLFEGVNLNQITGTTSGHPYDTNDNFLTHPTNDRTLSIPSNKILNVPTRSTTVQRKSKYQAALGAPRGGLFTDMMLTESIALRTAEELR